MDIQEELLEEQGKVLGVDIDGSAKGFHYEDLKTLPLHAQVVKETLRLYTPIHSVMRVVKNPMKIAGTNYIIPTSNVLLASPGVTSRAEEHFPEPLLWEPHRWDAFPAGNYSHLSPNHLMGILLKKKRTMGMA
jgi:sterol 14-demethylase